MKNELTGACLCGNVKFAVEQKFSNFYFCHCKECQKLTGSAFASNIVTNIDNIKWLEGEEYISKFIHPNRDFSKAFCSTCGSGLPYINKSKTALVIPAGSLNEDIDIKVEANIFMKEKATWFEKGLKSPQFSRYVEN